MPKHRDDDPPIMGEKFSRQRRYERSRTVVLSCFCAAITALVILYPIEVHNNDSNRKNCVIANTVPNLLYKQQKLQADNILGAGRPGQKGYKPPFEFKGSGFERYKTLILAQAAGNRARAEQFRQIAERSCEKAFPQPRFFGLDLVPGD